MGNNPKEKLRLISCGASYGEYAFVSKLSNREIKDAIRVLRNPKSCGVDENTRLASLHILELELAFRRSGIQFSYNTDTSS